MPEPARSILNKVRAAIRTAVPPGTTETISYGIPAFKPNGVLMWYAAFANHCSLFPTGAVIEAFKNELKGFSTSKGTIQFFNGQAAAGCACEENGEGACRAAGKQEKALTGWPLLNS